MSVYIQQLNSEIYSPISDLLQRGQSFSTLGIFL